MIENVRMLLFMLLIRARMSKINCPNYRMRSINIRVWLVRKNSGYLL